MVEHVLQPMYPEGLDRPSPRPGVVAADAGAGRPPAQAADPPDRPHPPAGRLLAGLPDRRLPPRPPSPRPPPRPPGHLRLPAARPAPTARPPARRLPPDLAGAPPPPAAPHGPGPAPAA